MNKVSFVVGLVASLIFIGFVPYRYGVLPNIWQPVLGVIYTLAVSWIGQQVFESNKKWFIGFLLLAFFFPLGIFIVSR